MTSTNPSSQQTNKNIVQPPPIPNVHVVVPPPPGVNVGVVVPPPGGQRIHFQPQTIQKNGTTTTITPQFTNAIRSPIKSTTTTLGGNITLNTHANVKVVPNTPPRQNFTSFSPLMNFPFSPQVGAINLNNTRVPKQTISLANLQNQIQQLPPVPMEEEANKRRKLLNGEPARLSSPSVINLDDENSNTSTTSSSDTPSTPLDDGSSRKRKRNETNERGCSCKKTGCLKRYCECFQNNRRCTESCNCQGCKNYDNSSELQVVLEKQLSGKKKIVNPPPLPQVKKIGKPPTTTPPPPTLPNTPNRQNFYTPMQLPLVGVTNLFDVVAGPDAIVELCKRLLLTTHRQEQIYSQQWQSEQRTKKQTPLSPSIVLNGEGEKTPPRAPPRPQVTPPKTPPIVARVGMEASPETLSLLCDEDDALHGAAATTTPSSDPKPSSKLFMHHVTSSHKGFEHSLQVALEDAVLQEFSHFLRDKLDQYYALEQNYGQQFSLSPPIKRR